MSVWQRWSERLDDKISPIVVKELRQAVRGRFASGVLLLFFSIQLVAITISVVVQELLSDKVDLEQRPVGDSTFATMATILLSLCLISIPIYTGIRLASERSDSNTDLLFISTLRPRSIILGKLFSAATLTAFVYSACTPFLVFTYFLRGIDMRTILLTLASGFISVIYCTIMAIFLATLPLSRPFKAILGFAVLLGLPSFLPFLIRELVVTRSSITSFWEGFLTLTAIFGLISFVLLALSTMCITPSAANRVLPVRIVLTITSLLGLGTAWYFMLVTPRVEPVDVWNILQFILISLTVMAATSERDHLGPRVLRAIPKNNLSRIGAFPFFSGALSGLIWSLLLGLGTMGALQLASIYATAHGNAASQNVARDAEYLIYLLAYALTAVAIRRRFFGRRFGPQFTWAVMMMLIMAGSLVPPLVAWIALRDSSAFDRDFRLWIVTNPFPQFDVPPSFVRPAFAAVWLLFALYANREWVRSQFTAFAPRLDETPDDRLAEA